jgi:O-succinylbenzoate synthase
MQLASIELRLVDLPLVRPFRTSFGTETAKRCVLVRVETLDGAVGWGESVTGPDPGFSEEWNDGLWLILRDFLVPATLTAGEVSADGMSRILAGVRGHPMAKASLINAVLDAELRTQGRSLADFLGAERDRVECGVSVGITHTGEELVEQVAGYLAEGYRRIKLKIAPGVDVERVGAVREANPGIMLSVDANAAYSLADAGTFRDLDAYELLMVEQPLHHEDLIEHAALQSQIATDICLDESIRSAAAAAAALELGACRLINIKQGRVGGLLEARRVHDVARAQGAPVWCGGMLETGVGRAANLALAALPGFSLPGDTSASARYFAEDLTEPFEMATDGTMAVPTGPGIGVEPRPERLKVCTLRVETLRA